MLSSLRAPLMIAISLWYRIFIDQGGPCALGPVLVPAQWLDPRTLHGSLTDPDALRVAGLCGVLPADLTDAVAVPVREDAGRGSVSGYLVFSSAWLRGRGIDTTRCVVAVMPGTAMEPSIADGAFVLVDQSRQAAREGRVYVVTAHAGDWSVNRVVLQGRRWVLSSDRAGVSYMPWRPGLELSGEVVWVSAAD